MTTMASNKKNVRACFKSQFVENPQDVPKKPFFGTFVNRKNEQVCVQESERTWKHVVAGVWDVYLVSMCVICIVTMASGTGDTSATFILFLGLCVWSIMLDSLVRAIRRLLFNV